MGVWRKTQTGHSSLSLNLVIFAQRRPPQTQQRPPLRSLLCLWLLEPWKDQPANWHFGPAEALLPQFFLRGKGALPTHLHPPVQASEARHQTDQTQKIRIQAKSSRIDPPAWFVGFTTDQRNRTAAGLLPRQTASLKHQIHHSSPQIIYRKQPRQLLPRSATPLPSHCLPASTRSRGRGHGPGTSWQTQRIGCGQMGLVF